MNPLQKINEYLELEDWVFKPSFSIGQHNEFYWITLDYAIDCADYIPWHDRSFSTLMISFDSGFTACCFGTQPNWRAVNEFAVSNLLVGRPELSYGAEFELMLFDNEISDQKIKDALAAGFDETNLDDPKFWSVLTKLQPYCYVANTYQLYFISTNRTLVQAMHSPQALTSAREIAKEYARKNRADTWEMLGPECGPEKCVEPNCDRLRIQLANRCFMHQMIRPTNKY